MTRTNTSEQLTFGACQDDFLRLDKRSVLPQRYELLVYIRGKDVQTLAGVLPVLRVV